MNTLSNIEFMLKIVILYICCSTPADWHVRKIGEYRLGGFVGERFKSCFESSASHANQIWYDSNNATKPITCTEPVRDWIKSLPAHECLSIGEDIKAVQFRWPLGMPLVKKLTGKLWEVRTQLPTRIARVLFTVKGNQMVLLHGFIKKTQATPPQDIALAISRIDF
jgi:phage-related protein